MKPDTPFYEKTDVTADREFIERIRRGDENALVELYQRNYFMVRKLVMQNQGSENDVEDLLQEALVILWQKALEDDFCLTSKISTYIYAVVRNLWLRDLRKRHLTKFTDTEELNIPEPAPGALDEMIDREALDIMMTCVTKLGEACRRLLLLFYFENKSMDEIATVLKFRNADVAKAKKWQCKQELIEIYKQNIEAVEET